MVARAQTQDLDGLPRQAPVLVGYSGDGLESGDPRPPFLIFLVTQEPVGDTMGLPNVEAGPVLRCKNIDPRWGCGGLEWRGFNGERQEFRETIAGARDGWLAQVLT